MSAKKMLKDSPKKEWRAINIKLTPAMYRQLKKYAEKEHRTVTSLIRVFIIHALRSPQ